MMNSTYAQEANWNDIALSPLIEFLKHENVKSSSWPRVHYIEKNNLPKVYHSLLTQPLMTKAVENYYQRTAQVQPLYQFYDTKQMINSRAVIMYVDKDKNRNNALLAHSLGQAIVAELGMISMNFAALPPGVIDGVKHSAKPFGALLLEYHVPTRRIDNRYFKITCENIFLPYLNCPNGFLFGRTGTLIRTDTQQWAARVVEILP